MATNEVGETWIGIRQPYLEGMLPYEYSIILKALKTLGVETITVYLEASSVHDTTLNGHVHYISNYFNKRFYKQTETGRDYEPELIAETAGSVNGKTLLGSEGNMLPSKTELNFAKKAKFDLYTITNLSFLDIAESHGLKPNTYAVTKQDLGNADEIVQNFTSHNPTVQVKLTPIARSTPRKAVQL